MVARQPANYDETRGFQLAGSILQGHPDIKGFVTGNDSIGLGAAAASKSQGKTGIVVVGIDGGSDAQSAIASGTSAFKASAAQPVIAMGQKAVDQLDVIIRNASGGVAPGAVQLLPCTLLEKK
jgi:erythritol transport system substrate-binding protein